MFATLTKYVGGKVLTAILLVGSGLTCYYFYRNPEKLEDLWGTTRTALLWLAFAAALPWTFVFIRGLIHRTESNAAAAGVLIGYLAVDIVAACWLSEWSIDGTLTRGLVVLGFMLAAVYNFVICDYLADQADEIA